MKIPLNDFQRSYAHHRIGFFTDLVSMELAQCLQRTSLACAENHKKQTGIIDIFCGLYLQDREEIARHFSGDFPAVVSQNFPIHRFGREGLFPKAMFENLASESGESGYMFPVNYSDDVLRLLWLSATLANAVGKKASLKDVIAAATMDREWTDELLRRGLSPSRNVLDFGTEVRTVIFHATPHMGEGWPRDMDFGLDETLRPPFSLEVSTPSGAFQPVRSAKVKLNGNEIAGVFWPEKPTAVVGVELRSLNKIEIALDGPPFGSLDLTVRGTPA
jgi:hypothetical protein